LKNNYPAQKGIKIMLSFFKKKEWPKLPLDEIRKRSRILVIDDSDFAYRTLFENEGYTIEKWDDVDDLPKLEKGYYDIILLDIQGVGKEHSKEQGLGILKHLHEVCPTQIIIAYSNADFSLEYQDFFKMADAVLAKADDYVQFKRTVDKLLRERFSLGFYLKRVEGLVSPYANDVEKVRRLAEKAILNQNTAKIESYLDQQIDNKDIITITLQVIQVAIGIAAI
jgi:CheY-like chemotaxis protein